MSKTTTMLHELDAERSAMAPQEPVKLQLIFDVTMPATATPESYRKAVADAKAAMAAYATSVRLRRVCVAPTRTLASLVAEFGE